MKHYKSVPRTPYFERDINRLAHEGYEFVAFYRLDGVTCALMAKEVEENSEKPRFVCGKCAFYLPPKDSSAARCLVTNNSTFAENECIDMEAREKALKEEK